MGARRLFFLLFTFSGAAGLIYEIVWMRLMALQMGHTLAAAGTVLAAFMGGLSAGALLGGRVAPRLDRGRALQGYAALECVIALSALALPLALSTLEPLFVWAYGDEPGPGFALVRLVSSLLLLFIPAFAMGATFPLAVRWLGTAASAAGRDAGGLYALNSAGAAVAALLTGFVLIPAVGLRATTFVGVGLNIAAAAGAWLIANRGLDSVATRAQQTAGRSAARSGRRRRPAEPVGRSVASWLPAAVLGLSGFAALVYEVTFTRVLALALGPTTYAFAAMLTGFVAGIAIGAAFVSRMTWTTKAPSFWLGLLMLASAAAASGAGWFAGTHLPLLIAETVANPSAGATTILARQALYAVGVLLPLTLTLGAAFPLGAALAARSDEGIAREVSVVYGVNTIGAVIGSIAGAFLLVPALGLQATLRLAGVFAVGAGCLAFVAGRLTARQRWAGITMAVPVGALLFMVPAWDVDLLSSGGYRYASEVRNIDLATGLKAGRLLYYREGATATVSVRRLADTLALAIDGKVDASNWTDMLTQKLLAHLPLLLHSDPHNVAVIGLGSGVTLGAALRHGIDRADIVEISPAVVEASSFFADANGHALDDPRTRLLVGDGRSHMQLTSRRYDVIISEPSNPWMAGIASLFTREFFLATRARLTPGGIFCQWAHTYEISEPDLRSIAATFASVFPNGTMWLVAENDVLFIASNDIVGPRLDNISAAWQRPGVAADLAKVSVFEPFSVLSLYVGGPLEVLRYSQGAFIQTDDRPRLEYSGPRGVYDRSVNENAPTLRGLLDPADAPAAVRTAVAAAGALEWSHRGEMLLTARAHAAAFEDFARSVRLDSDNETALMGLIDSAGAAQRVAEARQLLESLATARPDSAVLRIALVRLLAAIGAFEEATVRAREVTVAEPQNPRGIELLASIAADAGNVERLRPLVMRMQQTSPEREETWYYAAMVSFLDGNMEEAIARAQRVIQLNPRHAPAHNLIGAASATLGQNDRARQAFRASLEASPRDASTYANLGLLEMESRNLDAAVSHFAEALTLDPENALSETYLPVALAELRRR